MTSTTTNLSLTVYNAITDVGQTFLSFRNNTVGDSTSNMTKIDTWAGTVDSDLTTLKLAQPIVYVYATMVAGLPTNYVATVSSMVSYVTNTVIVLKLDSNNYGTVTLNITGSGGTPLGTKSVTKTNLSGTIINLSAGDLRVNKEYLFRYDGTQWVWIDATSADQLNIIGTVGNVTTISSDNGIDDSTIALTNLSLLLGRSGGQIVSGGITFNETLKLKGNIATSGNTSTSPNIQFLVGNSGATIAGTFLNNGNFGLGTVSPSTLFHAATATSAAGISTFEQLSADGDSFDIVLKKARGTVVGTPTVITSGDELGTIQFSGYSGAGGYVISAAIKAISSGTIDTTQVPAYLSFWTGTNAKPSVLTERMRIDNAGKVGIGTTTPETNLHIYTTGTGTTTLEQIGADSDSYDIALRKARGTTTPAVVVTADEMGTIKFAGYDGSVYITGASIKSHAVGTMGTGRIPGQLSFWTGTDATTSILTERMTIKNDGKVGIGTNAPSSILHVVGDARVTGLTGGVVKTDADGLMSNIVLDGDTTKFLNGNGVFSTLASPDGWIPATGTWTYSSTAAHSPIYVVSVNADMTGIISVGMKIKLTHATVKYFIVTAVGTYGGGVTLITLYGGTDYTLAAAGSAITLPYYSTMKSPFGFPGNPIKWTVETTDETNRTQATPTAGTWYNLNSNSIYIPIGTWIVEYKCNVSAAKNPTANLDVQVALSTANNSASDALLTGFSYVQGASASVVNVSGVYSRKVLVIAAETPYYLNLMTATSSVASIGLSNAGYTLVIRAICAYL